jgi:hypothetical protein
MFGLYIFYVAFSSFPQNRAEFPPLLLYGKGLENENGLAANAMFVQTKHPTDATIIRNIYCLVTQTPLNMFRAPLCPSSGALSNFEYMKMHGTTNLKPMFVVLSCDLLHADI